MPARKRATSDPTPMNHPNKEDCILTEVKGKGAGQGEYRLVLHEPDTERGTSVPRIERRAAVVFGRRHPRQEPYALTRPYGSVWGAISDGRPYRDSNSITSVLPVIRHLTNVRSLI